MTGPARLFASVFGFAYLGVALIESILGWTGGRLMAGGTELLMFHPLHTAIHWILGLGLLACWFAGRFPSRVGAGFVGGAVALVAVVSLAFPAQVAAVLGPESVMVPYLSVHVLTAALGLSAAAASRAQPWMVRGRTAAGHA